MHYLDVLGTTLNVIVHILAIAGLFALVVGFILSFLNEGKKYKPNDMRKQIDWVFPRWFRLLCWSLTLPALVFGIPALVVWFS